MGGTDRALCLSSARIWSLGLRLYLQDRNKGKVLNNTVNKRQEETINAQEKKVHIFDFSEKSSENLGKDYSLLECELWHFTAKLA